VASPIVYTSANTWQCKISGLAAGDNELTVSAKDSTGIVSRHSVDVTYIP
jgi:hypothetical protein